MKHFLHQLILFACVQLLLVWLLLRGDSVADSPNYLAESAAKHQRLQTAGPGKVVLVGGSSAAFGFSSGILASNLSVPAVNMGLAAGLGVEFMTAEVSRDLHPGDVVVFSFEYEHFSRGRSRDTEAAVGFDPDLLEQVLIFRPSAVAHLTAAQLRRVVLRHGLRIAGAILRRTAGRTLALAWNRNPSPPVAEDLRGFNNTGDFILHRSAEGEARRTPVAPGRLVPDPTGFPSRHVLDLLERRTRALTARGVVVAWSFPPRIDEVLHRDAALATRLEEELRKIPDLQVLDTPATHAYPVTRFYDTEHHLDGTGADLRSSRLAISLAPLISTEARSRRQEFP